MSVHAYIIKHPDYKNALELIAESHASFKNGKKPKNLRIVGVSGVGKSTLLKAYRDQYERYSAEEKTIIPVVYVSLPSMPRESAIYGEILHALGDPFPFTGRVTEQRHRIIKLFKKCEVELLILDEIQHFLDRGKLKTHTAHADALKTLIDAIERPVILAGAPRCVELFKINTQLRGRFKPITAFLPFSIFTEDSSSSFKKLMKAILSKSIFKNIDFFNIDDSLKRLFYSTDGVLRNISELISCTEEIAEKEKSSTLSLRLLQMAFQSWISINSRFSKEINPNPFNREFCDRRLTLPGELYEPSDLDGDNHGWKVTSI